MRLSNADIMGTEPQEMLVTDWKWSPHVSRSSGKEMIKVKYYGGLSDPVITEYFPITHGGAVQSRAYDQLRYIVLEAKVAGSPSGQSMKELSDWLNKGTPPDLISYKKNGKFHEVQKRLWI